MKEKEKWTLYVLPIDKFSDVEEDNWEMVGDFFNQDGLGRAMDEEKGMDYGVEKFRIVHWKEVDTIEKKADEA